MASTITARDLASMLRDTDRSVCVVDVRDSDFNTAGGHIQKAMNIPSVVFDDETQGVCVCVCECAVYVLYDVYVCVRRWTNAGNDDDDGV